MIERLWFVVDALTTSAVTLTIGVLFAAFIATRLLARLLRIVLVRIARRTTNAWDDRLATALGSPLSALLAIWALALALPWLPIEPHVAAILRDSIGVGSVIAVLWAVFQEPV